MKSPGFDRLRIATIHQEGEPLELRGMLGTKVNASIRYDGHPESTTRGQSFVQTTDSIDAAARSEPRPMTKEEVAGLRKAVQREIDGAPDAPQAALFEAMIEHVKKPQKPLVAVPGFDKLRIGSVHQ